MASKKENILFIAKNIPTPTSGGNKIIYTIAEKLSNSYTITFFFPKSRVPFALHWMKKHRPLYKLKDWVYNDLQVFTIPFVQLPGLFSAYWFFCSLPLKAKKLIKNGNFDLIHAHYGMPDGYLAYLIYKKYGIPYIITLRNHDILHLRKLSHNNPDYKKYHKVLDNAKSILTTNKNVQTFFSKMGFSVEIMPHGIEKEKLLNSSSIKNETINITCVSNYIPTKNIEWVIDAVSRYKGKKKIALTIIGDMKNSPTLYRHENEQISFSGKLSNEEVLNKLDDSDIFALPSSFETFGLVYLEAAAKHNAIIGHKNEGVWGIFENQEEMLFAESYDDFCNMLYKLIEDNVLRQHLSDNAYKKAQQLTWDKIIDKYTTMYSKV